MAHKSIGSGGPYGHDRLSKLFRRVEMYRAALFISGTTAMARQEPILPRPSKVPDVAECVKPPSAMIVNAPE